MRTWPTFSRVQIRFVAVIIGHAIILAIVRFVIQRRIDEVVQERGEAASRVNNCFFMARILCGLGLANVLHVAFAGIILGFVWPSDGHGKRPLAWEHLQRFAWTVNQVPGERARRAADSGNASRFEKARACAVRSCVCVPCSTCRYCAAGALLAWCQTRGQDKPTGQCMFAALSTGTSACWRQL